MRIPTRLDLGPYTLHLDVLAARLMRHRRRIRRWSIGCFTLVSTLVLATLAWTLLPWFHGTGTVILNLNVATTPSPDAVSGLVADGTDDPVVVTINGQLVATGVDRITLRSGQHTLTAQRANRFPVTLTFTVTQAQTTTLTLPPLRPIPIVQPVSLPSPDATWHAMAQDVSGGWRVQAHLPAPRTATTGQLGCPLC